MFFLKKIFQLRDHANPSAEKPFLEHLEDLRVCITRVILTLVIATVVCFIFRNELMSIIRRPIAQVWERGEVKALKKTRIEIEDWEEAKRHADAFNGLLQKRRAHFLERFDNPEEILENIEAVTLYRAARTFGKETEAQKKYIESNDGLEAALKEKVLALIDGQPSEKVDARGKLVLMQALKPTEGFMLSIKLAVFAGIVVSFPFLLYFLLQFVVPGMHDAERRALWPAMTIGFGLFLSGVLFAYFVVLPKVLEFFHNYSAGMMIENEWRIGYYISFTTQFTLIFGVAFELPVVVMTLVRLGVLNSEMMRSTRAYAILAIFVVAAIITPTPDAFTLCLLAGPMVILYEICIWLAYFLDKKRARLEAEEEAERMAKLLALKERRAAVGEEGDDGEGGDDDDDHDPHDPDRPDGPDGPDPHGPDSHGPVDPGHDPDHDPYHHDHGDDDYDYAADHGFDHDHDPEDDHYHTADDEFRADHAAETGDADAPRDEVEPGYGDDEHAGLEESEPSTQSLAQEDFDFHEEVDPALTEEGEQEDISDPWPEEGEPDEPGEMEDDIPEEGEPDEPGEMEDDIPEEEKNRDRDDPHSRDRD